MTESKEPKTGDEDAAGSDAGDDAGDDDGGEEKDGEDEGEGEMNDMEIHGRCEVLNTSINETVFNYIRRGLFEVDKLTVVTLMCLRIFMKSEQLTREEVDFLTFSKSSADPGNMGPLVEWLPEAIWPKIKGLETMKAFQGLT